MREIIECSSPGLSYFKSNKVTLVDIHSLLIGLTQFYGDKGESDKVRTINALLEIIGDISKIGNGNIILSYLEQLRILNRDNLDERLGDEFDQYSV